MSLGDPRPHAAGDKKNPPRHPHPAALPARLKEQFEIALVGMGLGMAHYDEAAKLLAPSSKNRSPIPPSLSFMPTLIADTSSIVLRLIKAIPFQNVSINEPTYHHGTSIRGNPGVLRPGDIQYTVCDALEHSYRCFTRD